MNRSVRALSRSVICAAVALSGCVLVSTGCGNKKQTAAKMPPSLYPDMGKKQGVPAYLKDSIFERVELVNNNPYPVSSYGLVGRLRATGNSTVPTPVFSWMTKEMVKRGFGSSLGDAGYKNVQPEDVLHSPNFAIVEVHSALPPGARKGDWIDAYVQCLPKNTTRSLSRGVLFETDLKVDGANPNQPNNAVAVLVKAKGPIVTNPAYALENNKAPTGAARDSLRSGTIMFNARVMQDRPLFLQLRQPQRSLSRAIQERINEHFQMVADFPRKTGSGSMAADAQDEGIVSIYVPRAYKGDWEHFAGVATHLFLDGRPQFAAAKAQELVLEAKKPGASLEEISYTWEGLGSVALPFILPLMSDSDPAVAYAAARAAAFIGDNSGAAHATLTRIAGTANDPFQISAIQVLGALPQSISLNQLLRQLLNSPQALVRVEAYKVLARNKDQVFSTVVKSVDGTEKFLLDIVPSEGPTIIYASMRGAPRIAIIGRTPAIRRPITFTALDDHLSITSQPNMQNISVYYRDDVDPRPVKSMSKPDVAELVSRLGGEGAPEERRFDFTYGEILAILKALSDKNQIIGNQVAGRPESAVTFMLQEGRGLQDQIFTAPVITDVRPQGDTPGNLEEIQATPVAPQVRPQ